MGETAVKRRSLSDAIKENPLLVIGIVISVVFILMPSYDHQNIPFWINGTSYLTNTNKFFQSSPWPGGFFFISLFIPIQFAYTLSGYSIYATVIVLKIILFAFTLSMGFLLYRMTNSYNPKIGKFVLAFTVLNPGIIYVNYVWAQLDVFPAFFLTLFVYLYFYRFPDRSSFKQTFISLIPLFITVFSFYFSIILVPTLLIYSVRKKHALNVLVVSLLLGVVFLLSQILLFRGLGYNYVASLVPSASGITAFGLQRVVPISSELLIIIFIVLSFLLPVATRVVRLPATVSMFMLLLLLIYAVRNTLPNNYLWLYPFSIVGVVETYLSRTRNRYFLITNLFFWVGIIFINLYIGTGLQAGIFYFMYDVFHRNILFLHNHSQWLTSTLVLFIALSFALIASVSIFIVPVITGRKGKDYKGEKRIESLSTIRSLDEHPKRKRTRTTILVVISSLVILSLMFNFLAPVFINTSEINSAPVYTFGSLYFNGNVAWPIEGLTYSINGGEINYYNNGNVISLSRNLSSEYINMTAAEQANFTKGETVPLVLTPIFNISEGYFNIVGNNENEIVKPVSWIGVKNISYLGNILASPPIDVHKMSLGSQIEYNASNFTDNTYYLFVYKTFTAIPPIVFSQTVLFRIQNRFGGVNSVFYNESGLISYVYKGSGMDLPVYTVNNTFQGWNYIWFYSTGSTLTIDINGYNVTINGDFFGPGSHLFIGNIDETHSFSGLVSDLYAENSISVVERKVISLEGVGNVSYLPARDNVILTISDNRSGTSLTVDGKRFFKAVPLKSIQFGKLSNEEYGLSIRFLDLTIVPRYDNGFYGIADFFAFILPYLFAYWIVLPEVINYLKGSPAGI